MIEKIVRALLSWQRFTRAMENVLIDAIAATAPWLAPLIPAWMTWRAMVDKLGFPAWVALAGAGVVELLGLSAITTVFQFWDYNDSKRIRDQRAPVIIAVLPAVFYLIVVLTVNTMLDGAPMVEIIAKALLSSLSVCAAVILALRAQHGRRVVAADQERAEQRAARLERGERGTIRNVDHSGNLPENSGKLPETTAKTDWRNLPSETREEVRQLPTSTIVTRFGVSERTARNWRQAAHNGHNGNGHNNSV